MNGMYQISCANKKEFKSIFLFVDNYWLEIHPDDYILEMLIEGTSEKGCVISIGVSSVNYFILGDSFLRGYYVVHDMQNNRIGIAPSLYSSKQNLE